MNALRSPQTIALLIATLIASSSYVGAGVLQDVFGVTPKLDTKAPAQSDSFQGKRTYHFDYDTLRPAKNPGRIFYFIDDWHGSWSAQKADDSASNLNYHGNPTGNGQKPSGGEPYDVEAVYWGIDDENVYVAMITSSPHPGFTDTRFEGDPKFIVAGDIGIDLNQNDKHSSAFAYDYAIDITHEKRPWFGDVSSAKGELGGKLYRTKNNDWYTGTPDGAVDGNGRLTNFDPSFGFGRGTYVADVKTAYYEYTFPGGLQESLTPTYVVEATIPKKMLKSQWSMSDVQPYTSESNIASPKTSKIPKTCFTGQKIYTSTSPLKGPSFERGSPDLEINFSYVMGCRNDCSVE